MKTVMVIAGGAWQVPLVKRLKEMGYRVVNSNLYPDSPGFEYADECVVANVLDREVNLAAARKYEVDAVLTDQSDIAVPTVAYVTDQLGLKGISPEGAELFTNKEKMRLFCEKIGMPVPEHHVCQTAEEAVRAFESIGAPAILKPLDSQSSRGVVTVYSKDDIEKNFADTQQYSHNGRDVLVERYIQGTEFTVEGIVKNGKHHTLAISEKSHYDSHPNIARKLKYTHSNDRFDYEALSRQHNKLIDATGVDNILTHSEYKYEDGTFYLIEMAARGGGTKISSDIVPFMSDVDTYKVLIENALGQDGHEELGAIVEDQRCAILEFLDVERPGSRVVSIEGEDAVRALPYVMDFKLDIGPGDVLSAVEDDRSRYGYFIVGAPNEMAAEETAQKIKDTLKLRFAED